MYYAGYEAGKPSRSKIDVTDILLDEISAPNIDTFLKYC